MNDGLEDLERRIATLIARHREAKEKIQQQESRMKEARHENERLGRENEQLRARLGELETELASRGSREEVVKNRLQQILGQIDTLEAEIASIEAKDHEPGQTN